MKFILYVKNVFILILAIKAAKAEMQQACS